MNPARRIFLKYLGFGAAGFAASRLLSSRSAPVSIGQNPNLKNFSVKERAGSLIFYNALGRRLFQLHQDGEMEIG